MKKKFTDFAIGLLAVAGIAVCFLSTIDHFRFIITGSIEGNICGNISDSGCLSAHRSRFSEIFGYPITLYGISTYMIIFVLSIIISFKKDEEQKKSVSLLRVISIFMVLYSIFLATVLYFTNEFCIFCFILYIINSLLLILSFLLHVITIRDSFKNLKNTLKSKTFFCTIITFIATAMFVFPVYRFELKETKLKLLKQKLKETEPLTEIKIPPGIPLKGAGMAKIKIIEISDFECPFCEKMFFILEEFYKSHKDNVMIGFLNYPLDTSCNPYISYCLHVTACEAAKAGICASNEGLFWEYAGLLYQNRKKHEKDDLMDYAESLGIDRKKFDDCISSEGTLKRLSEDLKSCNNYNIRGTPTIIINGKKIEGALSLEELEKIIQSIK